MLRKLYWLIVVITGLALSTAVAHATTHEFYKGKTIRIVVGFSPGGAFDLWARAIVRHWSNYIPGNPELIVQNMPGGASMIAANYIYNLAKPDGLTIGMISPALVFDQLGGRKEVQFDWARFLWIGSPEQTDDMLFIRSDSPYKTLEDIRKATVPPRCGAIGTGNVSYYFPKLVEETLGPKFHIITGYPGAADINLALERGEVQCQSSTTTSFFGREPGRTWAKTGFVRALVQSGTKRDPRIPDVPTIRELMEKEKAPEMARRVATAILSPGLFGRPFVGSPGIPADRVKALREGFMKAMADPELLAEAKKRDWEANPVSGERLEALTKEVIVQPPEVIERMKKLLGM